MRSHLRVFLAAAAILSGSRPATAQQSPSTLITNASVLDGTGAPARKASVRVAGGRIVAVGTLTPARGETVVDAGGLTLAPGFIDTHSHHDWGLLEHRDALAAVSQGITTIIAGQDGESQVPLAGLLGKLDRTPAAINVASYVGHGTVREMVMGKDFKRAATAAELERMKAIVRTEMASGALGLSSGLEYDPGIYSAPGEVIELAKVAGRAGGRYISHVRSEDRKLWAAMAELINIGRVAKLPVQVSHMKLGMRGLWGQGDSLLRMLDRARAEGIDVTADVYPWTMWSSTLTVLYPDRNFTDRKETEFILREVAAPGDLLIGTYSPNPAYSGKTVEQIAAMNKTDAASTLMKLIADSRDSTAHESVVATGMDERDIKRFLAWPHTNVCSDGELDGHHPRGFGSFPRVLGHYVREQHVMPLEEAVRKMTSLAAAHVGLTGRGTIAAGQAADLVLFDPATVADRATTKEPHALSAGISTVWVNGTVVFEHGAATGKFPGRALRRPARR